MEDLPKLMTRKGLLEFANAELGIPLTKSTIEKRPPTPDAFYGRTGLFSEQTARRYVASLVSEKPKKLVGADSTK